MFVTLVFVCAVGCAFGQTITPNTFDLGANTVGVTQSFVVTLHNNSNTPQWIVRAGCAGEAELDFEFLNAKDNSPAVGWNEYFLPDSARSIIVRITPKAAKGPIQVSCSITFVDSTGYQMDAAAFTVTGQATQTSGEPELYAPAASVAINDVAAGSESSIDVAFVAQHNPVTVTGISLQSGDPAFSLTFISLPYVVASAETLIVNVRFHPTTTGVFNERLLVNTSNGAPIEVAIQGTAVIASVDESITSNVLHPNPSNGTVEWCSSPLDAWLVVNQLGTSVATINADEQGVGSFTTTVPGIYLLVNARTRQSQPFVVIR